MRISKVQFPPNKPAIHSDSLINLSNGILIEHVQYIEGELKNKKWSWNRKEKRRWNFTFEFILKWHVHRQDWRCLRNIFMYPPKIFPVRNCPLYKLSKPHQLFSNRRLLNACKKCNWKNSKDVKDLIHLFPQYTDNDPSIKANQTIVSGEWVASFTQISFILINC